MNTRDLAMLLMSMDPCQYERVTIDFGPYTRQTADALLPAVLNMGDNGVVVGLDVVIGEHISLSFAPGEGPPPAIPTNPSEAEDGGTVA